MNAVKVAADWIPSSHMPPPERAPAVTRTRERWISISAPIAVFLTTFLLAWFRLPPQSRDTFWAEDARTFSERALDPDLLPWSIFTSYDGYVHALPQAAALALWNILPIPVASMAQAFTAAACAIAAAVAAGIYLLTAHWGLNVAGRLMLAFTTVLVPGLSFEVLGNVANSHWFLLWLAPFLFLARPRRWWTATILGIVAFIVLTSEVQSALFTPLLLWHISDRKRWPMAIGAFTGGVIQLCAVLGGGRTTWGEALPRPVSVLEGYAMQVPLLGLSGTGESASAIVANSGWPAAAASIIPFVICAVWWAWPSRQRLLLAVGALFASLAIWTAGYALNQASMIDFGAIEQEVLLDGFPLLRYAIVPLMLLYAFVGLAVGRVKLARSSFETGVAAAAIVMTVAIFAVNYSVDVPTQRLAGPTWAAGLEVARAECAESPVKDVVIWIAPYEFWRFTISCDDIAS